MTDPADQAKPSSSSSSSSGDSTRYIKLYESEEKIYTRRITGFYQKLRRYTGLPLIAGFVLLPWLTIDNRPAMLFDLPERKFHIFWMTFGPQDGFLLGCLLIISAFLLFTVTAWVGRVWCGFTCPQTVWTQMFIWAEHFCQGDRNKRIKLDNGPLSVEKVWRYGATHFLWVLISLITSLTFVGYFMPIRELLTGVFTLDIGMVTTFWVGLFTFMTYLNAGWMREQVCKYMCPYARFQSVMYDRETMSVTYDYIRGEPRGPRKVKEAQEHPELGDCVDCSWCVQVCPVNIDIRDGAQYECIDCGLCIDACNTVMDKMGYEPGLIRFTTEEALETGKIRVWRPRLIGYAVALVAMLLAFSLVVSDRVPLVADVSRDRGARLYREVGNTIQNVYTIKIHNMDRQSHRYNIDVSGALNYQLSGYRALELEEGEVFAFPVRVSVPKDALKDTKYDITFTVSAKTEPEIVLTSISSFIGPRQKE